MLPSIFVLRSSWNYAIFVDWLKKLTWTPESIQQWQEFYNDASRLLFFGGSSNFSFENLPRLPEFKDLKPPECKRGIPNSSIRPNSLIFFTLFSFLMTLIQRFL